MLDFCYLVNPYFRTSKIIEELEANFRTLLGEYPSGMRVNTLLASKCWGVKEEYIIPGNGAAELIKSLMESTTGKVGIIRPTFEEYPNRLKEDQIVPFISSDRDFRYGVSDLIGFYEVNPVETLLLINPDNPSGNFIPLEDINKIADWCENNSVRLVVDESFVDFCDEWETSSLLNDACLESHPHLVVIKSISKSYGVPGLRLGIMASADTALIKTMKNDVSIWNINSFAEFFMQIYTKYDKDYKKSCFRFIDVRSEFMDGLSRIPYLHVMPTQANFVLCEVLAPYTPVGIAISLLKKHNILISVCSGKKGLTPNRYIRLAVRSKEDNDMLLNALQSI